MAYRYKYFPAEYAKEFKLLKECQNLSSDIFAASASAKKEYRFTLCKKIHDLCCELVHSVNVANSYQVGTEDRMREQKRVADLLLRIDELLPVLRRCRCISLGQEGEITKKIGNIKISYEKWVESDMKRIGRDV